ncbi:3-isopropylmalate dehydratase [Rhodococcus sp. HNM0563]|nr:3-isopropylmalate dehydratase [Rhodococcus sp. HNM0563]
MTGPALFLTEDPDLRRRQLVDQDPSRYADYLAAPLLDNISTDEIIPGWCCYWYDEKLGDFAYLGLRDDVFDETAVRKLRPQIVVSGMSKGCGSSREHAVYAERYAGIEIVFARSFEKIYEQNCRNVGIITCDDFGILNALLEGAELPLTDFNRRFNDVERTIIDSGGLFGFNRQRPAVDAGKASGGRFGASRPLNSIEKIIQRNLSATNPCPPNASIVVGESYFVNTDVRFSHEYVTPMAAEMFSHQFGDEAPLADPDSCYFFQDHLSLAGAVLERRPDGPTLVGRVRNLHERQREFAAAKGGTFVGTLPGGGSEAICHNYILENVAAPSQLIIGTDSHTCTAGAVGAFAFGVGATDIANSWYNREILTKVPEVVQVRLVGQLRSGTCAKDIMLTLLAHPVVQSGKTRGRVLAFTGAGCATIGIDERATLCNMAVEARGVTAYFEPDEITRDFLEQRCPNRPFVTLPSDPAATYAVTVTLDLDRVEPMVSLPGDPTNSVPITTVPRDFAVNKVYGGSCTGGKAHDMDMYAAVLSEAHARGLKVPDHIDAYIQMGSSTVLAYASERGYVSLFESIGVNVLPPSCGACINAGPGVSESTEEITVSAQNRNFPGRSGPGSVYLASPYVVAATAVAGRLCTPMELFNGEVETTCVSQ